MPPLAIFKMQEMMTEVVRGDSCNRGSKTKLNCGRLYLNTNLNSWEAIAAEAQFRPAKMAELCRVSLRTVERHFRKNYNLTVKEWARSVRMQEAKRRILEGSSIKAVSYELGFKQASHFSRIFKEFYGTPPSFLLQDGGAFRFPTKLYSENAA